MKTTPRSSTRAIASAFAALLLLALLPSSPAVAFDRDRITIRQGPQVKKSYPAFASSYVGHQAETAGEESASPTPDTCNNTGGFNTACDVVPVRLVRPDISARDDWLVTIRVTWPPEATGEDIDVFLFDDGQYSGETSATGGKVYTRLGKSATAAQPEQFKLISPEIFDFNLVVAHFSGVSQGYTVSGTIATESIDAPFDVLTEGGPPNNNDSVITEAEGDGDLNSAPVDFSDSPPAFASGDTFAPPTALPEIAILPDADLDIDGGPIESQFAAPVLRGGPSVNQRRPAKPVPAPVVIFWFVVVPAALVGGGYLLMLRRNRSAFSFG
jgi:hypothetical protein